MDIRFATTADLPVLMELFAGARRFMVQQGNPDQWWGGYPTEDLLREDICQSQLYVCEEGGHIYAAFVMALGEDPTYQKIDGAWKNDLPYATLHRIASTGERRGMVDEIVRWAFARHANLRGDTHELNRPMQQAFERNGFVRCGTIWVADGTPRIAYQKVQLPKLVVIAGTNASGKSGLGIELAKRYGGEVVSADSRQVFRGLDLGSGKITPEETQGVPHHLIDVCDAGDFYSMADFQKQAYAAIDDIIARGKIPFLVGGTGLYVASVADGYVMSDRMPDLAYRNELEKLSTEALYRMLIEKIPNTDVEPRNRNRVMRVLEKLHDGDDVVPAKQPRYETLRLGVTWKRDVLRQRIDERLDRRLEQGMIDEVKNLLDAGVSDTFMLKLGLEYKFITQYIRGEYASLEEMKELLATAIKQFAKRQMTWFRRDNAIHWLDMTADPIAESMEKIDAFLRL